MLPVGRKIAWFYPLRAGRRDVSFVDERRGAIRIDDEIGHIQFPFAEGIGENISVHDLGPHGLFAVWSDRGARIAVSRVDKSWIEIRDLIPAVAGRRGDPHIQPDAGVQPPPLPGLWHPTQTMRILFDADEKPTPGRMPIDHRLIAVHRGNAGTRR